MAWLDFEGLKIGARLTLPTGYPTSDQCTWGPFCSRPANWPEPAKNLTETCASPWRSKSLKGPYRVTAFNVSGNVDNDGDGWKVIHGVTSRKTSFVGPL